METVKFKARLFVTTRYKGWENSRSAKRTLDNYIKEMRKESLCITSADLIKENSKSGRHDGYAIGNYYKITGTAKRYDTIEKTKFFIFHDSRVDYFNCFPILIGSIKIL